MSADGIKRDDFDDKGMRYAECERCGMGWLEYREPVELFAGEWTTSGERPHECPEPLSYEQAKYMADTARAMGGVIVSPKMKARIKLGLASDPRQEGR